MLIRISGYNNGAKEYLEEGVKSGREYTREELDERLILHGDLDLTQTIYQSIPDKGQNRYTTLTLAFREDDVNPEILSAVTRETREFLMYAYEDVEYNFYAEAHIPKIKEIYDKRTGELIERKPHIHIIIPKLNLLSGNVSDIIGDPEMTEPYLEAFQEYLNQKYNLASPREHVRVNPYNAADVLSRYKGDDFRGRHREFKQSLVKEIIEKDIRRRVDFYSHVAEYGETRIRNAGKENEYIAVRLPGDERFTNLKETIFNDNFIVERKLSRPPLPKHVIAGRLQEWPVKAKEIKYIVKAGEAFRNKYYRHSDPAEKLTLLAERQYQFYEQYGGSDELHPAQRPRGDERSTSQTGNRGAARTAGSLQGLPGSDVAAGRESRRTTGALFLPGNARVDMGEPEPGGDSGLRSDLSGRGGRRAEESRSGREADAEGRERDTQSGGESREGRKRQAEGETTPAPGGTEGRSEGRAGRKSPDSRGDESERESRAGGPGRRESPEQENAASSRYPASSGYPHDAGSREEYRYAWVSGVGGESAAFHVRGRYGAGQRQLSIPPYARSPSRVPGISAVDAHTASLFSDTVNVPARQSTPLRLIKRVMPRPPKNASYVAACLQRRQSRSSLSGLQQRMIYQADQKYFDSRRAILGDNRLTPKEKTQYLAVLTFERLKAHQRITQPEGLNQQETTTMGSENIRQHVRTRRTGKNSISGAEEKEKQPVNARQRFARMAGDIDHNLGERSIREKVRIITAADLYTRKSRLSENIHYLDKSSDKTLFVDTGKSIAVSKNGMSESAVAVALELAKEKFGSTLTVKGSAAFKNTVIEAVAQKGMDVHFTDKEMNRRLAERKAELAIEREGQNISQGAEPVAEPKTREEFADAFRAVEQRYEDVLRNVDGMSTAEINKQLQEISATRKALTATSLALDVEAALDTAPEETSESLDDRCRNLESELEKLSEQKVSVGQPLAETQATAVSESSPASAVPLPQTREELVDAFRSVEQRYEDVLSTADGMSAGEIDKQLQQIGEIRQSLSRASLAIDVEASLNGAPDNEGESLDDRSRSLESQLQKLSEVKAAAEQPQPSNVSEGAQPVTQPGTREEFVDAFRAVEERYTDVLRNAPGMSAGEIRESLQSIREDRKALTRASLSLDVEASLGTAPVSVSNSIDDRSRDLEARLRQVAEARAAAQPEQEAQPAKHIVHEGVLLEHGEAPYQFKPDMRKPEAERNDSYFVRLQKPDGAEKIVWGVTLEKAVAGLEAGENIRLENMGKETVQWTQAMADGSTEQRTGERVAWKGTSIDRDVDHADSGQEPSYQEYETWEEQDYGPDVA